MADLADFGQDFAFDFEGGLETGPYTIGLDVERAGESGNDAGELVPASKSAWIKGVPNGAVVAAAVALGLLLLVYFGKR